MDREVPPQDEIPPFGHRDGKELPGPRPVGDLRRDERDGLVRTEFPRRQDLGPRPFHALASAFLAASSNVRRACTGAALAAS